MKEKIKLLGVFVLLGAVAILISLSSTGHSYDTIWLAHIMSKISNGDVIYKDINVIVGPIFYEFCAIFFKLFGNSLLTYKILGGIFYGFFSAVFFYIIQKFNKGKNGTINALTLMILFFNSRILYEPNYNIFSLFWAMIVMFIETINNDKKRPVLNILTGMVMGICFYTKQTIGVILLLATLIISLYLRRDGMIKEIISKISGFILVIVIGVIWLVSKGIFIDYLNYNFGGLIDFGSNNVSISIYFLIIAIMLSILINVIIAWNRTKKDNNIFILTVYLVALLAFAYPIFNLYHTCTALTPMWLLIIYFINICNERKYINLEKVLLIIPLILYALCMTYNNIGFTNESTQLIDYILGLICVILLFAYSVPILKNRYANISKIIIGLIIIYSVATGLKFYQNLKNSENIEGLEVYWNLRNI